MSDIKFRQIAETIEARINTGVYPANTKLPPHRVLADELETTPTTVSKAYKLLAEKNKVESFVGRGTFVCGGAELETVIQAPDDNADYNFSILQPCLKHNILPLQAAFQQTYATLPSELLGYIEHSGHLSHRQAGMKWAAEFGLSVLDPDDILLASGAQNALAILIQTYTKPGDCIAVEAFTYPGILSIANLLGRRVVEVAMDSEGMCPTALKDTMLSDKPKVVVIVPSHQNPTGVTMPQGRRESIAKVIAAGNIWLLEDDIYGFLNPSVIPAISNYIPEKSFHITSLSKAISPALRCAFIKAPKSEIRKVGACIRTSIWLASPLNFAVATQLINSGAAFSMANKQKQLAAQRQAFVAELLGFLACSSQPTSYHIWVKLPKNWRQEHFVMEAKNQQLLVSSGGYFSQQSDKSNHIRLSLMAIDDEQRFQQGVVSLANLLQDGQGSHFLF
ncbi:MAG: PLP-dependent aminotransferase family protein [Moritella sp.]|uniref:aminotransferase-like domain-containing protein n=1 Tax=Moritella sp. TaxID=78556 RepID=UPI0029B8C827|nr:PLP-dependent aminotransferase family protein [Moritella sp.]MDX2319149.1 PLP-dependent aminotransferase family protein [Moritella sp.]